MNRYLLRKYTAPFIFLAVAAMLAGCSEGLDEGERQLLMRDDPNFRNLMEMRDEMQGQIDALKQEIAKQENAAQARIAELKKQAEADRMQRQKLIDQMHDQMGSLKENFQKDLTSTGDALAERKKRQAQLTEALANAREVVSGNQVMGLSADEVNVWTNRINDFEGSLNQVNAEISELESQLSLKKRKIKYL